MSLLVCLLGVSFLGLPNSRKPKPHSLRSLEILAFSQEERDLDIAIDRL